MNFPHDRVRFGRKKSEQIASRHAFLDLSVPMSN